MFSYPFMNTSAASKTLSTPALYSVDVILVWCLTGKPLFPCFSRDLTIGSVVLGKRLDGSAQRKFEVGNASSQF